MWPPRMQDCMMAGNSSVPTPHVVKLAFGGSAFIRATKASVLKDCPPATPQTKLKFIGSLKIPCLAISMVLSSPPMS